MKWMGMPHAFIAVLGGVNCLLKIEEHMDIEANEIAWRGNREKYSMGGVGEAQIELKESYGMEEGGRGRFGGTRL